MDGKSVSSNEDIYDGFEDDDDDDEDAAGIREIIKNGKKIVDFDGLSELTNDEEYEKMDVS